MSKSSMGWLVGACGFAAASVIQPALASPILDQSDTVISGSVGLPEIGQSFNAGLSGQLSSIFVGSPSATSSSGAYTVNIYGGEGEASTSLLASALLTPTLDSNGYTFDTTSLMAMVTAGQQYTFDIAGASGQTLGISGDVTGAYTQGQFYFAGTPYSAYNLDFATYVDPAVSPVPEPSSLALIGAGLCGLIAMRRRRSA